MPLVLGVDSSTQSTKVELRDADSGQLVAAGRGAHPPTTPPKSEQPPDAWWNALRFALAETGSREVAAVGVAGQQHGLVVLDSKSRTIRPAKLWNDTESASQAVRLVQRLGPEGWAARCGSVPVASFTITKLAWMRENEPEAFARIAHVLLPHDWLTFQLTGSYVTDRGDASGTGYFSPTEGRWRLDLLQLVDPGRDWIAALPQVLGPSTPAGQITSEAARFLGLSGTAPVVGPGTGDNMAAALGMGLRPGDVAISIGTSGTVYAVSSRPTADPSGQVAGFADATGEYLPLVCTLNATKVTDAFRRILDVDPESFDLLACGGAAGAGGLVLVPYLDGERTPNRPEASGTLFGIRSDVTPSQVARAAVEGVVCGLLDGVEALASAGVSRGRGGRFFIVGGGARSRAYRQILADLLQEEVLVPEATEHVARGACVQAAAALSGRPPAEVAAAWSCDAGKRVEPTPGVDAAAVRAAYAAARGH